MREVLAQLPASAAAVLTLLIIAETALVIGIVLPGSTAAIGLGTLAHMGTFPLAAATAAAAAAAMLGGQLGFLAGRREAGNTTLLGPWVDRCLGAQRTNTVHRLLRAKGVTAVVLGQWVVGARTLVPRLTGRAGLPHRRFSAHQLPTASIWATGMVITGYGAGAAYERTAASVAGAVAGALTLAIMASWLHRQRAQPLAHRSVQLRGIWSGYTIGACPARTDVRRRPCRAPAKA